MHPLKLRDEIALNHPKFPKKWTESIVVGFDEVCRFINNLAKQNIASSGRNCLLALDGFLGVEWQSIVSRVKESLKAGGLTWRRSGL